ncbi:MAG: MATE family efflux transporter [Lachnospiraceae bacterium]|jgi:putative MATE family efflux protein|nr:MATE family efflux transporter [Lachnospiraceae bacterium]
MSQPTSAPAENKMGVMPVNKLIINMSLPMIISMLVQALYNVVDSVFVVRVSQDALTAVSLAFPVQNLMIAVGAGTGVGINSYLSKSLGEKKYKEANRTALNGLFVIFLSYLLFAIFGLFFSNLYFTSQTDIPQIIKYGNDYMFYVTVFSFGLFFAMTLERLLQATGITIYSMIAQTAGAVTNIVLDPILIFGLFGLPRLEVAGAAIATVIGQIVGMCVGLYFNLTKNRDLNLSFKGFRPHLPTIGAIYSVGLPSIIMQSIGSVMTYGMNRILLMFTSTAVSVFGAYFKLQSFIFMPIFGLNNGLIPIIAYNYGARKKERIIQTIKTGCVIAVGVMLIGLLLFQLIPGPLLSLFSADDSAADMAAIGVPALRIISLSFLFAGFCIIASAAFQALGKGMYSLLTSLVRQIFVILPVAYLFATTLGLDAVWFSFPIAELFSTTLCVLLLKRTYDKLIKNL